MLELMQKNLRKCKLATQLAIQSFISSKYSVALFQEPYNMPNSFKNNSMYQCHKASYHQPPPNNARYSHEGYLVITLVKNHLISSSGYKDDYILEVNVRTNIGVLCIINVYVPPTRNINMTLVHLQLAINSNKSKLLLICGDFNARSRVWGDIITSHRGNELIDFLGSNNLTILNEGEMATYESSTGRSNIDVSFISQALTKLRISWKLEDTFDGSDHRTILMSIGIQHEVRLPKQILYISNETDTKLEILCQDWQPYTTDSPITMEEYIKELTIRIQNTMIWKTKTVQDFKSFPWWNNQIKCLRNNCRALRKRYQSILSSVNPTLRLHYEKLYKDKNKELKRLIKSEKIKSWKNFIGENCEIWGKAYKAVFHNKYKDYSLNDGINKREILNELFPPRHIYNWETLWNNNPEDNIPITVTEIENALNFSSKGKAPGIDGIPAIIWQKINRFNPSILLSLFNNLYNHQYFPNIWKISNIVLLPKPGVTNNVASSFRPISLLPTVSKIYERILLRRLNFFIDSNLDKRQFGFRRCIGTNDALERLFYHHRKIRGILNNPGKYEFCCIFIDIKGAFNNFDPLYCLKSLHSAGCPNNYINIIKNFLRRRILKLEEHSMNNENGSPQGSCLSPILWNLIVDGLFKMIPDSRNVLLQAFADDVVIYVHHLDYLIINQIVENICSTLNVWATSAGLIFSIEKCCFLTSNDNIKVKIQHKEISRVQKHKYLGVIINQNFSPKEHIQSLRDKSRNLSLKLAQIYKKNWGISNINAKRIYLGVIEPILTYGATAWYDGTVRMDSILASAQRAPLLRICNTFKTVSTEALQILSGILPIDLKIREMIAYRTYMKNGKYDVPLIANYHPGILLIEKTDLIPNYGSQNIFTDGSKTEQGSGSAMIHLNKMTIAHTVKTRLSCNTDNFICEMQGILDAINYMNYADLNITIFTDSQASINCLINNKPKIQIACQILEAAFQSKKLIKISWIKGHSGDYGNDIADNLAKSAINDTNIKQTKPSLRRLKIHLEKQSMHYWKDRWVNSEKGRTLFQFFPTPKKNKISSDFYVNQFLTGHGYFPAYFKRFRLRNTPCLCKTIRNYQADAAHFINQCPAFSHISRLYFIDSSWRNKKHIFHSIAKQLEDIYSTKIHRNNQNAVVITNLPLP
jgi:ribonuclease HI